MYQTIYGLVDCNGKTVERSMEEYPYSYSNHLIWFKSMDYIHNPPKGYATVYSDRLYQWDSKKFNDCCYEVWKNHGQSFSEIDRTPEAIEKFLSLYFGRDIELIKIGQECNVSSGYPLWIFYYMDKD